MRLLSAGLVALTPFVVACGSQQSAHPVIRTAGKPSEMPRVGCPLKVTFSGTPSRSLITAVEQRAAATRVVQSITFVPKSVSLATFRQRYPALTKSLTYNPLPDQLIVELKHVSDAGRVEAALANGRGYVVSAPREFKLGFFTRSACPGH